MQRRNNCRLCGGRSLVMVVDLGKTPLAGLFLEKKDVGKEKSYPLRLYLCRRCHLVQMLDIVPREELFTSFLSSVTMARHFLKYAKEMRRRFVKPGDFAVEIGSNDGALLEPLQKMGIKVLGVDPVRKITKIARDKGIPMITDYFSLRVALKINKQADLILANNVLAHIDDMDDIMQGVRYLLKPDGTFVFEVHSLVSLLEKLQYDTIYHEHLSYYSVSSLAPFLRKYDLEITEVKPIPTHAGSIRVYCRRVYYLGRFDGAVEEHKKHLNGLLLDLKNKGKKVVGYGAAGRANTLLNYCGITSQLVEYIMDESPERYDHFTPGTHIPVVHPNLVDLSSVDYIMILAWNYTGQIKKKARLQGFKGKFIIPLPEVKVTT